MISNTASLLPVPIQAWEFSGGQGSFSAPITILFTIAPQGLLGAPTIMSQPVSLVSAVGETATFTVGVTANPAATYQWKKNGFAIAGATGASLSIANVLLSDAGSYFVSVVNSYGAIDSAAVTLDVLSGLSAPSIFAPLRYHW